MTVQSSYERPRYTTKPNSVYEAGRGNGNRNNGSVWGCLPRTAKLVVFAVAVLVGGWVGWQVSQVVTPDAAPGPTVCCYGVTP